MAKCETDQVCMTGCYTPTGIRQATTFVNPVDLKAQGVAPGRCKTSNQCKTPDEWLKIRLLNWRGVGVGRYYLPAFCTADTGTSPDQGNVPVVDPSNTPPLPPPGPDPGPHPDPAPAPDSMVDEDGMCYFWKPVKGAAPGPPYICHDPQVKCSGTIFECGLGASQNSEFDCRTAAPNNPGLPGGGWNHVCHWDEPRVAPPPGQAGVVVDYCNERGGTRVLSPCINQPAGQVNRNACESQEAAVGAHGPVPPRGVCRFVDPELHYAGARARAAVRESRPAWRRRTKGRGYPPIECNNFTTKMTCEYKNPIMWAYGVPAPQSTGCTWFPNHLCAWSDTPLAEHGGEPGGGVKGAENWKQGYCRGGWRNSIGKHGGYCEQIGDQGACERAVTPNMFLLLRWNAPPVVEAWDTTAAQPRWVHNPAAPAAWVRPLQNNMITQRQQVTPTPTGYPSSARVVEVYTWFAAGVSNYGEILVQVRNGVFNTATHILFSQGTSAIPIMPPPNAAWPAVRLSPPTLVTPDDLPQCVWDTDKQRGRPNWCRDDPDACQRGGEATYLHHLKTQPPAVQFWGAGTCSPPPAYAEAEAAAAAAAAGAAGYRSSSPRCFSTNGLSEADTRKWFPGTSPRYSGPPYGVVPSPFYCGDGSTNILSQRACRENCGTLVPGATCSGEGACQYANGNIMMDTIWVGDGGKLWCNETKCPAEGDPTILTACQVFGNHRGLSTTKKIHTMLAIIKSFTRTIIERKRMAIDSARRIQTALSVMSRTSGSIYSPGRTAKMIKNV